jgi:hypothetical protein
MRPPDMVGGAVILFLLLDRVPAVLLLAQVGMLYLVVLDVREETDVDFQVKAWWLLLVLLLGVPGFVAAKVWVHARRRRGDPAPRDRRPAR